MIKKTLVGLSTILIPFTAFACTVNNDELVNPNSFNDIDEEQRLKISKEIRKIYNLIMPKYKNLVKLATFIPPIWLDNNERIKQTYIQNQSGGFNTVYFDENVPKIKERFIEISSKELFNSLIINRFKELHNHDDFNDDILIKELFEFIYLDNKDVYNLLKDNNIYIFANYGNITQHNSTIDYLVPFYDHDKITLNIIVNDQNRRRQDVVPQSHSFGVFVLPKSKELKFEILEDTRTTNDNLAYYKTLYNWYNNSYLKVYKDKKSKK